MSDIKWIWNFDVYDESDSPTEEGYYRIIDDEGNEATDYYFNEPRMTHHGIGYWRDAGRPIIAWRFLGKDEPQTDCDRHCKQTEVGCEQTDCPWGKL